MGPPRLVFLIFARPGWTQGSHKSVLYFLPAPVPFALATVQLACFLQQQPLRMPLPVRFRQRAHTHVHVPLCKFPASTMHTFVHPAAARPPAPKQPALYYGACPPFLVCLYRVPSPTTMWG